MQTARLRIDPAWNRGPIDARIFGSFVEHMGRCVYEGIYDPASPLADENGFRTDVIDAVKQLGITIVRYPGGNYVSACDWKDGIGPRNQRPTRPDFAWRSLETNQFGTDEFMAWCKAASTEPMMAVNLGTGTAKEAMELVEYCNFPDRTYWAKRRAENGHPASYGVRVWCLGNEMDGDWQAGQVPADVYAHRADQATKLMKGVGGDIQTVVCGSSGTGMKTYLEWDRTVLEYSWDKVDYLSIHRYSGDHQKNRPHYRSEGLEIQKLLDEYRGVLAYVKGVKRSSHDVYLSFDEWNVWYKAMNMDGVWKEAPHLIEEVYDLDDALVVGQYMNAFLNNADFVKIACQAQLVNIIGLFLTRTDGLLKQSIAYAFELYSRAAKGVALIVNVEGPSYEAGPRGPAQALDVSASFDPENGHVCVFIVNRSEEPVDTHLDMSGLGQFTSAEVHVITGPDGLTSNTWESPNQVVIEQCPPRIEPLAPRIEVPPLSISRVSLRP